MDTTDLTQQLQRGLRVALGATAAIVESFQDPRKRDENLAKLRLEWHELSEEWARKGEQTEQEARGFVDTVFGQQPTTSGTSSSASSPSAAVTTTSPDIQVDIQELTAQIAAMRAELEQLKNKDSSS
jgi:polyhydroxyalkanoate synthesis regulator phasin